METQDESSFQAYVFCENCYCHKKILINKGLKINDAVCPNCGNKTLKIDPNGEIMDRPHRPTSYI